MNREFNVTGSCNPRQHYMVNLDSRLAQIKNYVERGRYFIINRGRQYGKTTTLKALSNYLCEEYIVVRLDFQGMSASDFKTEESFVKAFARELWLTCRSDMSRDLQEQIKTMRLSTDYVLADLFVSISEWCSEVVKPIILLVDEVDSASNNQIFFDFLAQLRRYYLDRSVMPTFQSVILAGVHDIRNLKVKIRPESEHRHNSPWNIASSFDVEMSFNMQDIAGMLSDYETDHNTGMDIHQISRLIYDYTSGYPVLVSTLCKYMDEDFEFTKAGFTEAVKKITSTKIPLFESLINKLEDDEKLCKLLYDILFGGNRYHFNVYDATIDSAAMYGFISRNNDNSIIVANRIFEIVIYEWFISVEKTASSIYSEGEADKNQFIQHGQLDMDKVLEKFIIHFNDIYGSRSDKFKEDDGRKLFLLYLRPIINGTGNYYIEAQTRDQRRTDVIVDYLGKQYIVELKIWHGDEYNTRGEQQLSDYLDFYHIGKGYLLSFNFNKNKQIGMQTIRLGDKTIVEAVV